MLDSSTNQRPLTPFPNFDWPIGIDAL